MPSALRPITAQELDSRVADGASRLKEAILFVGELRAELLDDFGGQSVAQIAALLTTNSNFTVDTAFVNKVNAALDAFNAVYVASYGNPTNLTALRKVS